MFKLRSTWNDVITPTKLHTLDVTIHALDKNWPISAAPPNIHVNPKFLNNVCKIHLDDHYICFFYTDLCFNVMTLDFIS